MRRVAPTRREFGGAQFARKLEMTELVYETLNKNGIEIPFPTHTLYVKQ